MVGDQRPEISAHPGLQTSAMSHKQVLRPQVKALLRGISLDELARQSEVIAREALAIVERYGSQGVGCFMNMDHSEVRTESLIRSLFLGGKKVYLPRCSSTDVSKQVELRLDKCSRSRRAHLVFHAMESMGQVDALQPQGRYQLREPQATDPEPLPSSDLGVILVPGVAFGKSNGARMGHGAGYYDDYVSRHVYYTGKRPLLVGLALKQQLLDEVPLEKHDYAMDCILCGDGTVRWYT
ncbi:unnamed protein product [Kluyveromyces dobzhanskii CBS 2104]|uniref:5-formyltetrahydrofolate cyclo-ligase n=1 Tax=Kluyveromyces dobzhanskii CBS 2104 TaxID=1427455 RepID=A0A0A8KZ22_9SACH|nr:unnamed protein product [Kluyveromyces dobzhanskii CBS 2104]